MHWWKQFKPKACSVNLKAGSKEAALSELISNLVKGGVLAEELEEAAVRAVVEREALATTGIGKSVAIPHIKLDGLDKVVCALAVHKEGLEWAAPDGDPVHVMFTVLRPSEQTADYDPAEHLEMMSWVAKISREPDFRSFARAAATKTELVDLLKEMSAV